MRTLQYLIWKWSGSNMVHLTFSLQWLICLCWIFIYKNTETENQALLQVVILNHYIVLYPLDWGFRLNQTDGAWGPWKHSMEDSSEGRWLNLIFCPPSYHPSLTQARMVGGHHHQVVSHQRNSKTSFLGSETAASLTHMFISGVHARLPTCTETAEMSEKCFHIH